MARLPRLAIPGHAHALLLQAAPGCRPLAGADDRADFLRALREAAALQGVALHAWALHDTEVRLLATPAAEGALARLVQDLGRRFVAAHHRRHGGRGTLWDGRYRCSVVEPGAHRLQALLWAEEPVPGAAVDAAGAPAPAHAMAAEAGSAGHRLGRWRDAQLAELPEVWALGNTPFEREAAYAALHGQGVAPAERQRLLRALRGGWPYGGSAFLARLARDLQRPLVPRAPGRPRRGGTAAGAPTAPPQR